MNLWKAWCRFWFFEIDPFVMGLYRVCLGCYQLAYYLILTPNWLRFYGPNGIVGRLESPFHPFSSGSISLLNYISTDMGMWFYFFVSIACALCLIFGIFGRLPLVWLWVSNFSVQLRHLQVSNGEEQVMALLLFFSLFMPLHAACTPPKWFGRGKEASFARPEKVNGWALRLLQTNFVFIYIISLPFKLLADNSWWQGTAVYYSMMSMTYARWPGLPLFSWGTAAVSHVLSYYALAIEGLFPLLVWFRRFRLPMALGILFLHLGLAVFFRALMLFNLSMAVGVILFLPSRRTKRWMRSLAGQNH